MVRNPCTDRAGLKKGTWTIEEDRKLIAYVTQYGCWNWRQLPKYAGLSRCGKSCRLRWLNYLRPDVKRGNFTKEEEDTIIKLHASLGNRWSAIAAQFTGRTDNDIKNHWHSYLKKRSTPTSSLSHQRDTCMSKHDASILEKQKQVDDESCNKNTNLIFSISPRASQNDPSSPATTSTNSTIFFPKESDDNFWTQPFVTDEEFDKLFDPLRDEILLSPPLHIIGADFPSLYDYHVLSLQ